MTELNEFEQFNQDRDEALLSLDRAKIEAFASRYGISMPEDDDTFWGGIHKARLHANALSEEEKEQSRQWLRKEGFSDIDGSPV